MSNKPEYHAIYKCRLCGEHYDSAGTTDRELVMKETMLLCLGIKSEEIQAPQMMEAHLCKNGSVGIADFKGWMLKK
jgi:hypothetical protein